jgi:hypothetical protein
LEENETTTESLATWLSKRAYWEQCVWKLNFEKESLEDKDIEVCYQTLLEEIEPIPLLKEAKENIDFEYEIPIPPETISYPVKARILEVKDFENVNALSKDCSVKFSPNLTLIYGANGTGKSGVARLLCNACFYRGNREILPNLRLALTSDVKAKASFLIDDTSSLPKTISYVLGNYNDLLKRFSVFDADSVLIHLDKSNKVIFTPARIKIFDKVTETISKLETMLSNEGDKLKRENPFELIFAEEDSDVAIFCKGMTFATDKSDLLKYTSYDVNIDEKRILGLRDEISDKMKLDISKRKAELITDCEDLKAIKEQLQNVVNGLTEEKAIEYNKLITDSKERDVILEELSVKSFDDGIFKKIGSPEWKALIVAAKSLYDSEKKAVEGKELSHCLLCHQKLQSEALSLYTKYWKFLENKAETELVELSRRRLEIINGLRIMKSTFPQFLATDAGIKLLANEKPLFLAQTKDCFNYLESVLDHWISAIVALKSIEITTTPKIDFQQIDDLVALKTLEEINLLDPTNDISKLKVALTSLEHKKKISGVKEKGLEYLDYLKWLNKIKGVNFAGIKMAITKKRTEFVKVGIAMNYIGVFKEELKKIGSEYDLVMHVSGELGNTVKEFRLTFAEDYEPSQILSEGERNVCSLADFLTEINLDNNNCGIILDDPVTSLDHERRDKIAYRLAIEASVRQVIVFSHDIVFMSQLVKHADNYQIPFRVHWMQKVAGVPGIIEEDKSPKMASLASLKKDYDEAVLNYSLLGPKEKERALACALDYLRSACEALIEELLFAETVQRYDDHIRVQNLEEVPYDKESALKIVDLHGKISEIALMHNRSDIYRQSLPSIDDFNDLKTKFEALENELKEALKKSRRERSERKKEKGVANIF